MWRVMIVEDDPLMQAFFAASVQGSGQLDLVCCVGASGGLLAAAIELRNHLAKSSDGRKALRDLGFEPVPQNVEGE